MIAPSRQVRLVVACCWAVVALPVIRVAAALAQAQTPVVLVPGFNEGPGIWGEIAYDLASSFSATVITPSPTTSSHIGTQASQVRYGWLSSVASGSAIAIGHSNGGLVSRETAKLLPLRGIVTFGTPHHGVPLLFNAWPAADYAYHAARLLLIDLPWDFWWRCDHFDSDCSGAWAVVSLAGEALVIPYVIGAKLDAFLSGNEVLDDDYPGSSYLASLNSGSNLATEAASAPARAGLVVTTQGYLYGGPLRFFFDPGTAEAAADFLNALGVGFLIEGFYLSSEADATYEMLIWGYDTNWDWYFAERALADDLLLGAYYLLGYEWTWCLFVSGTGGCVPNDLLLPTASQTYPGTDNNFSVSAIWEHDREWQDGFVINALHDRVGAILQSSP